MKSVRACHLNSQEQHVPHGLHDERAEASAGAASHALQEQDAAEVVARLRLRSPKSVS